jgi:hypothetical protein
MTVTTTGVAGRSSRRAREVVTAKTTTARCKDNETAIALGHRRAFRFLAATVSNSIGRTSASVTTRARKDHCTLSPCNRARHPETGRA